MKILIVGTGYIGLVTGVCFAELGIDVICVDVEKDKIDNLKKGISPIYEEGLDKLLEKNIQRGTIQFSTDLSECLNDVDVVFSAVGTPPDEDGSADLKYVIDVAKTVGKHINKYVLVVTKSTVPVGTAAKVRQVIQNELDARNMNIEFDVASNPEFLKGGSAVKDFMYPERIVIGVESERAEEIMKQLYKSFILNGCPVIFMDVLSAEMTKYAANAMLATRISFMNDIANVCELLGADVNLVRRGIGSDSRIGSKFLYPGIGYGGSCFPKDVKALIKTAEQNGYNMRVLKSVNEVNEEQKTILFKKFQDCFNGDIIGKTVAMWGLSFKPGTDDMREAPSLALIDLLTKAGCKVNAFDPVSMNECKRRIGDKIKYAENQYEALVDADALFLVTEWTEFRFPNWAKIKGLLKTPVVFDGRNIYEKNEVLKEGLDYIGIGFKCT